MLKDLQKGRVVGMSDDEINVGKRILEECIESYYFMRIRYND